LASNLKAKVIEGPIVRKVNYIDRQVEVRSDLVSFDLTNPNNKFSKTVLAWTMENLERGAMLWFGEEQVRNLNIFEMSNSLLYQHLPR